MLNITGSPESFLEEAQEMVTLLFENYNIKIFIIDGKLHVKRYGAIILSIDDLHHPLNFFQSAIPTHPTQPAPAQLIVGNYININGNQVQIAMAFNDENIYYVYDQLLNQYYLVYFDAGIYHMIETAPNANNQINLQLHNGRQVKVVPLAHKKTSRGRRLLIYARLFRDTETGEEYWEYYLITDQGEHKKLKSLDILNIEPTRRDSRRDDDDPPPNPPSGGSSGGAGPSGGAGQDGSGNSQGGIGSSDAFEENDNDIGGFCNILSKNPLCNINNILELYTIGEGELNSTLKTKMHPMEGHFLFGLNHSGLEELNYFHQDIKNNKYIVANSTNNQKNSLKIKIPKQIIGMSQNFMLTFQQTNSLVNNEAILIDFIGNSASTALSGWNLILKKDSVSGKSKLHFRYHDLVTKQFIDELIPSYNNSLKTDSLLLNQWHAVTVRGVLEANGERVILVQVYERKYDLNSGDKYFVEILRKELTNISHIISPTTGNFNTIFTPAYLKIGHSSNNDGDPSLKFEVLERSNNNIVLKTMSRGLINNASDYDGDGYTSIFEMTFPRVYNPLVNENGGEDVSLVKNKKIFITTDYTSSLNTTSNQENILNFNYFARNSSQSFISPKLVIEIIDLAHEFGLTPEIRLVSKGEVFGVSVGCDVFAGISSGVHQVNQLAQASGSRFKTLENSVKKLPSNKVCPHLIYDIKTNKKLGNLLTTTSTTRYFNLDEKYYQNICPNSRVENNTWIINSGAKCVLRGEGLFYNSINSRFYLGKNLFIEPGAVLLMPTEMNLGFSNALSDKEVYSAVVRGSLVSF